MSTELETICMETLLFLDRCVHHDLFDRRREPLASTVPEAAMGERPDQEFFGGGTGGDAGQGTLVMHFVQLYACL